MATPREIKVKGVEDPARLCPGDINEDAEPKRPSEVEREMGLLSSTVENLTKVTITLQDRLCEVLKDYPPIEGDAPKEPETLVPLAESIRIQRLKVERVVRETLEPLIDRIEL